MSTVVDDLAANSLGAQQDAMGGPLETAMRSDILPIGVGARIRLAAGYWEPMLQVAPRADLGSERLLVSINVVGAAVQPHPVSFEPLTEQGHWITFMVPGNLVARRTASPIELEIAVRLNGTVQTLTRARELVEFRVVEGMFARFVHLLSAEQARLRHQTRKLHEAASLDGAQGFMLDRYGQELGVPRLSDRLIVRSGQIVTDQQRENDADYRRRLALYRRWFGASRAAVVDLLNGSPGSPGPMQAIGGPNNFVVEERDNPLFSAMKIVSVGATAAAAAAQRGHFLNYLRGTILIDPTANVPAARAMPLAARQQENALRLRLRNSMTFADPSTRSMAPFLAAAFDRLTGLLRGFGVSAPISVIRAQHNDGGVRHELGLGAELERLPAASLTAVRNGIAGALPTGLGKAELVAVASLRAMGSLADPLGTWLFEACGFASVEPIGTNRLYVSHLPISQMDIAGPSDVVLDATVQRSGVTYAANLGNSSTGLGLALAHALGGGTAGWPSGDPPWTAVAQTQLDATLDSLAVLGSPMAGVVANSGVAVLATADIPRFVAATKRYPSGSAAAVVLNPTFASNLASGSATTVERWSRLLESLGTNGAASAALFLGTGSQTILLVSAHGLPLVGSNIGARRSTSFYWHCMAASDGAEGSCRGSGTETVLRPTAHGLYALHCLGSARIGDTDPFEYRVDLPTGTQLNLAQYEMVMNMLTRCFPVGIEINTWALRRSHIDLGTGTPTPLTPRQSRSFRRWQRPQFAGVDLNRPDFLPS